MRLPLPRSVRARTARAFLPWALFLCAIPAWAAVQEGSAAVLPAPSPSAARILRSDLERDVHWLAHDDRKGRDTGSPEAVEAARWLAEELRKAELQPGGDDKTFLQRVALQRAGHAAPPKLHGRASGDQAVEGAYGVDFERLSGTPPEVMLPLLVVRSEADLPAEPRADAALLIDAQSTQARAWLEAKGQKDGKGWGLYVQAGARTAGQPGRASRPRLRVLQGTAEEQASVRLRGPLLERALAGGLSALRIEAELVREDVPAFNVIGVLAGKGTPEHPELAKEAVVFTAHYDHIGVRAEAADGVAADRIFNGADDDASGCAAVLALARAFAASAPPARTLIFVLVTGEEVGLLGTHWYLDHPLVPLEQTVCNLNFEMVGRPDALAGGPGRLWLTGFERSNLGQSFASAGLDVVADPRPDQNFFQRSDNYAFALRGIVAQTLSSYDLHKDYHTVDDEPERLDFAHMESAVRAAYLGARGLADGSIRPEWRPGGNPKR